MDHVRNPTETNFTSSIQTVVKAKQRPKSKPRSSSFFYRDIFIWIFFVLFVPIVFFSVYYFSTINNYRGRASDSEQNLLPIDDTNYLSQPNVIIELTDRNQKKKELHEINFSHEKRRPLMKISLSKYKAFCNDGSYANYYLRLSESHSKDWLILVDGGFFCYDSATCQQRFFNSHNFTSSKDYKSYRYGNILEFKNNLEFYM